MYKRINLVIILALLAALLTGCSMANESEEMTSEEHITSERVSVEQEDSMDIEVNTSELQEESNSMEEDNETIVEEITSESESDAEVEEEIIEITESEEVQGEKYRYSIVMFRNEKTWEVLRWEISIYDNQDFIQEIVLEYEPSHIPDFHEMIWEEDVNFDGVKELLIHRGYFGVQGAQGYECYIFDSEQNMFVWCPGFMNIANPKVDVENQMIIGTYRSDASTYKDEFFVFTGNSFEFVRGDVYVYDEELGKHVYTESYTKDDL